MLLVQPVASQHATCGLRTHAVQTGAAGDGYDGAVLGEAAAARRAVQPLALSSVTMPALPVLRRKVTTTRAMVFGQSRKGEEYRRDSCDSVEVHIAHLCTWTYTSERPDATSPRWRFEPSSRKTLNSSSASANSGIPVNLNR